MESHGEFLVVEMSRDEYRELERYLSRSRMSAKEFIMTKVREARDIDRITEANSISLGEVYRFVKKLQTLVDMLNIKKNINPKFDIFYIEELIEYGQELQYSRRSSEETTDKISNYLKKVYEVFKCYNIIEIC